MPRLVHHVSVVGPPPKKFEQRGSNKGRKGIELFGTKTTKKRDSHTGAHIHTHDRGGVFEIYENRHATCL